MSHKDQPNVGKYTSPMDGMGLMMYTRPRWASKPVDVSDFIQIR